MKPIPIPRGDSQSIRSRNKVKGNFREKHWRSIAKTFSWRITATFATLVISYLVTEDLAVAGMIGGIEFLSKIFLYYLHERAWGKIYAGMEVKTLSQDISS